jgi:anthraniloyl-CoA monooxygenase
LSAAAELRFDEQGWPEPYLSGKAQLERNLLRAAQAVGPV